MDWEVAGWVALGTLWATAIIWLLIRAFEAGEDDKTGLALIQLLLALGLTASGFGFLAGQVP